MAVMIDWFIIGFIVGVAVGVSALAAAIFIRQLKEETK